MSTGSPFAKMGTKGVKFACKSFCKIKDNENARFETCNVCADLWHVECIAEAYREELGTSAWQCQQCRKDIPIPQKRKPTFGSKAAKKRKKNGREAAIDLTSEDAQVMPLMEDLMRENRNWEKKHKKLVKKNQELLDKVKQLNKIEGFRKIRKADLEKFRKEEARSIQQYQAELKSKHDRCRRWKHEERDLKAMVTELANGFRDDEIIDCQKTSDFRKNLKKSKNIVKNMIPDLEEELRNQDEMHKRSVTNYKDLTQNKKENEVKLAKLEAEIEKRQKQLIETQISIQRIEKRIEKAKVKRIGSNSLRKKSEDLLQKHKEHKEQIEKAEAKWTRFEEHTPWIMLTEKPLKQWTPLEVANWFGHLNSGKYMENYDTFLRFVTKRQITGEFLGELGKSDWTSNGIVDTYRDQQYLHFRKNELIAASDILCQFKKGFKEETIEFLDFTNYLIDQGIRTPFTDLYEAMKDSEQKVTIRSMFDWCVKHLDAKKGDNDLSSLLDRQSPQKKLPPNKDSYIVEGSHMFRIAQKLSKKGFILVREEEEIRKLRYDFAIFENAWIRTECIETALIEAKKEEELSGWSALSQAFGFGGS